MLRRIAEVAPTRFPPGGCPRRTRPPRLLALARRSAVQLRSAVQPPSTGSAAPLTKPLCSGSTRKAIAAATSSGDAKRPHGRALDDVGVDVAAGRLVGVVH